MYHFRIFRSFVERNFWTGGRNPRHSLVFTGTTWYFGREIHGPTVVDRETVIDVLVGLAAFWVLAALSLFAIGYALGRLVARIRLSGSV
jgi:hypothetical protein